MLNFLVHLVTTLTVAGIMWFIQVVHYPLLRYVGQASFVTYEKAHTRLAIGLVVSLMVIESATGVLLLRWRPAGVTGGQVAIGLVLLGIIWVSTMLLQVPQHHRLASGFSEKAHRILVESNWIRTACYTARAFLLSWMVFGAVH